MSPGGQCKVCEEECDDSEKSMTCSECDCTYHTGKCAGVSDTTVKSKGEAYRRAWRCTTCRRSTSRSQLAEKMAKQPDAQDDVRVWLKTINDKLDLLLPLKESVESLEDAVHFMSEQYDQLLTRTEKNEHDVADIKGRLLKLEEREEVTQLKAEVDYLEWQSRKLNLEFHGIPQTYNENLLEEINALAGKAELPQLLQHDIVAIHRLPAKKGKTPAVICRFAKQMNRDEWWQNRKKLSCVDKLFLQENITKRTRALLFEVKNWAKINGFKYVWHHNGRVLVRKTDGENAVAISSSSDLSKLR
ncbi:uncharacterized protein [Dermacentor albipictus]|uniref:uncharacterized protein n=1 Tax=Dermacentor albipictus TaxID=60249 RepID=UPI0031FBC535